MLSQFIHLCNTAVAVDLFVVAAVVVAAAAGVVVPVIVAFGKTYKCSSRQF